MTESHTTKYFAYGSNMAPEVMASACAHSRLLGRARLNGYRFAFNRRSVRTGTGVANIIVDPSSSVWGVVYEITDECLAVLDQKEGYPWAYDRKDVEVELDDSTTCCALTYVVSHPEAEDVAPSHAYIGGIVAAASAHGFPRAYVDSLRALVPAGSG